MDPTLVDLSTDLLGFRPLEAVAAFIIPEYPGHGELEFAGLVSRVPARRGRTWREKLAAGILDRAIDASSVKTVLIVRYSSDLLGDERRPVGYDDVFAACKRLHEAGFAFLAFVVAADSWCEYRFDGDVEDLVRGSLDELRAFPIRTLSALRAAPSPGRSAIADV